MASYRVSWICHPTNEVLNLFLPLRKIRRAMRIDIITVLPKILESPFQHSIIKRAQEKGLAEIHIHNLRDYSEDKHRRVDDYSFGKGAGMVMAIQPIEKAIETLKAQREYDEIIFTTPDGKLLDQREANYLSLYKNIMILCGHYKGIDQRIRDTYITKEISVGDYVLTGGELAAAIITDSVVRLLPGVLSDETSALSDSFQDYLLSPPVYTRPAEYKGLKVPEVLLSGNDKLVDDWKHDQAIERTKKLRPDLYKKYLGEE
ncbi:tRNA (guanosine(37)-N1)-methyltransferase TrmD [Maribellus sediminis]|uniref:tRNA (guanosine(37)-N1)-methyltransferase TrmD n=1 Tax=Maribellus sediminis TaxID=2696285 RepID=UPI001F0DC524|nr:tRNA (guanosine(37)-N1)-methyltransferase TrmD [Maribellus sediminis]